MTDMHPFLASYQKLEGKIIDQSPSQAGNWLKGKLIKATHGSVTVAYTVREEMTNPGKILHGGIMSLMLDEVIGASNFLTGNEYLMTSINLSVDFLSPARVGDTVLVTSQLVREGKNINHWQAEIRSEAGKLIAKASSNLITTPVKISDLTAPTKP